MFPKVNANVSMEENISLKSSLLFSSLTSLKFTAYKRKKKKKTKEWEVGSIKQVYQA